MENGLSLHYPGNTVIAPKPGRKRQDKVVNPDKVPDFEAKVMKQVHKVCAASVCVWCGHSPGQYFITCAHCGNCQYCGLMDSVDPNRCFLCGNFLPPEARIELVKINTVSGDVVEYDRE